MGKGRCCAGERFSLVTDCFSVYFSELGGSGLNFDLENNTKCIAEAETSLLQGRGCRGPATLLGLAL